MVAKCNGVYPWNIWSWGLVSDAISKPLLPCLSNISFELPDRIVGRQDLYNDDSRLRGQADIKVRSFTGWNESSS